MAEGLGNMLFGDKIEAFSAGTKPTFVNPRAIIVMNEIGIDISGQKSQNADDFIGQQFDFIITLCENAKDNCPFFPGKAERLHWNLSDPAEADGSEPEILKVFRATRDMIKKNIEIVLSNSN